MRSWIGWRLAASAACVVGAVACSDDGGPDTGIDPLQGQSGSGRGGSAGSTGAVTAGTGGMSMGGRGGMGGSPGGSAGSPSGVGGGAGSPTGGSGGIGGAAGGAVGGTGGAAGGGQDAPDAGGGEPEEEVAFSDVFPILVARCGNCHGAGAPRPQFAQANNQAASFAATELTSQNAPVSERIVTRAVVNRNMPPNCNNQGTCVTADEADQLEAWVDQGAQE
jgi:hypothetical protein